MDFLVQKFCNIKKGNMKPSYFCLRESFGSSCTTGDIHWAAAWMLKLISCECQYVDTSACLHILIWDNEIQIIPQPLEHISLIAQVTEMCINVWMIWEKQNNDNHKGAAVLVFQSSIHLDEKIQLRVIMVICYIDIMSSK